MRLIVSKIMLVCFLAAAIVSKTDGASANNAIDADPSHIATALSDMISGPAAEDFGEPHSHDGQCACEAKSSKSASLICGVVLAMAGDGEFVYVPLSIRTQLEWHNRFGPELFQQKLTPPPHLNLNITNAPDVRNLAPEVHPPVRPADCLTRADPPDWSEKSSKEDARQFFAFEDFRE